MSSYRYVEGVFFKNMFIFKIFLFDLCACVPSCCPKLDLSRTYRTVCGNCNPSCEKFCFHSSCRVKFTLYGILTSNMIWDGNLTIHIHQLICCCAHLFSSLFIVGVHYNFSFDSRIALSDCSRHEDEISLRRMIKQSIRL